MSRARLSKVSQAEMGARAILRPQPVYFCNSETTMLPFRTFITPGFFPRLEVVLKNLVDEWGMKFGKCICNLEKGFCRLIVNDMEILVEYSGYFDYFVDIMVKSYLPQPQTVEFLEANIISKIRRLCASPKGCQGVTLAEAIIRPDCCDGGDITLCRFRQAVPVATLEDELVLAPDLRYCFPSVQDEHGTTVLRPKYYHPQNLLDTNSTIWEQSTCYPDSNVNAGKRRGMAVIVSMLTYNKSGLRSGGLQDQAKLATLVGDLEFNVRLLQDCNAGELQRQIKDIAGTRICAQDESLLCFVMGHGDSTVDAEHFIWDQDWDMIMLDDIIKPFKKCEHLQGKPKVFFVISCRGSSLPLVPSQPQVPVLQPMELLFNEITEIRYLQDSTDSLRVFSTSVGSPSARYPGYGSTFVGAFVKSFNHDKLQTTDVLSILSDANKEIATKKLKAKDGTYFGQCPVVVHTLTKRLFWKSKAV